jgi:hypothetical protein
MEALKKAALTFQGVFDPVFQTAMKIVAVIGTAHRIQ